MTHKTRAILLANATAATFRGRRCTKANNHAVACRWPGLTSLTTAVAPTTINWRKRSLPCREIPPRRCLPPVDFCFGLRPSQAAKCRPDLNCLASTVVASVSALSGPIPGSSASSGLSGLVLCRLDQFALQFGQALRQFGNARTKVCKHLLGSGRDRRIRRNAGEQRFASKAAIILWPDM
jgi:hypothetical protein